MEEFFIYFSSFLSPAIVIMILFFLYSSLFIIAFVPMRRRNGKVLKVRVCPCEYRGAGFLVRTGFLPPQGWRNREVRNTSLPPHEGKWQQYYAGLTALLPKYRNSLSICLISEAFKSKAGVFRLVLFFCVATHSSDVCSVVSVSESPSHR